MASPSLSVAEEEIENFIPPGNLRLLQLHFDFTTNLLFTWGLVATSFCLLTFHIFNAQGKAFPGIPVVGRTGWFEPIWRTRLRFIKGCGSLCYDGFTKFKTFRLVRPEGDVMVLDPAYLEEIRVLPERQLSSLLALNNSLLGKYSTIDLFLGGDLHLRVINTKMTQSLPVMIPNIEDELRFAMAKEMPRCEGYPNCRNEGWLDTSFSYAKSAVNTIMILKLFPPQLHPIVAFLSPPAWNVGSLKEHGISLLTDIIDQYLEAKSPTNEESQSFLWWMISEARDDGEKDPSMLARRLLLMSMALVPNIAVAVTHAVYDLCAHPEYIPIIREETRVVQQGNGSWNKSSLDGLWKLDSFLRESQTFNPPRNLGYKHVSQTALTLSDGLHIPPDCTVALPVAAMVRPSPSIPFDGLRWYRQRLREPGNSKLTYATADRDNITWGYGRYACPGRFFASNMLKIILAHLVLRYDFAFPEGQSRPANVEVHEFIFPDPKAEVWIKEVGSGSPA